MANLAIKMKLFDMIRGRKIDPTRSAMMNRKHVEELVNGALSQGNVEKATKIATNFSEGRSTIKNKIKQNERYKDLRNQYDPSALTPEEIEQEAAINNLIENAEAKGNLQGAPSLQLRTNPNASLLSKAAKANGMLVKAKENYDSGSVNGFKKARAGLKQVSQLYNNAKEYQKAKMARTTLKKMTPLPAMELLQQIENQNNIDERLRLYGLLEKVYHEHGVSDRARTVFEEIEPKPAIELLQQIKGENDEKKRLILYGKLASVYSKYGMTDKASEALKMSVAGGRRRTKINKKSTRRTRRR
jgi:tetratricopeptide (TPR) repeat protein